VKIALSTIGKFHSFDLARQMYQRGALSAIYSGYPWFKLKNEGLPRQTVRTFPYLHAPYMRLAPRSERLRHLWEWQDRLWFDNYVANTLPACDIFCGLSGSGLQSGRVARMRGAKYVCDRGSTHIRVQDTILREEYDRQGIPFSGIDRRVIEREESEYDAADLITVPSSVALKSFVDSGVSPSKLRLIPYGVDLGSFYPSGRRLDEDFHILFVGGLCVRKGVSYLVEAFRQLECERKRLTLVGTVTPEMENLTDQWRHQLGITITGHLSQPRLREMMNKSHVLVLPSVEEGLALVQAQAMACGCPVIATNSTGAQDLFSDGQEGFIIPNRDTAALVSRLQQLAEDSELRQRMSQAALRRVKSLGGWEQYGEKMHAIFSEVSNS
jgi:alpha-maltose-1-phosphate synthase